MPMFPVSISPRTRGFTLVELLLGVFVLGLFLSLAAVNWTVLAPKGRETFLETFSVQIAVLKEEAIAQYDDRAMEFDVAGNTISAGRIDKIRGYVLSKELPLPSDYKLRNVVINGETFPTGKPLVRFYPSGMVDRIIVHLDREASDPYSIIVDPLTARVTGKDGYIEDISLPGRNKPS